MRIMRSAAIAAKQHDYVKAARALGASTPRILVKHLLPNCVAPVLVYATIALGEFMTSMCEEITQAEHIGKGDIVIQVPHDVLVIFDRGHLSQIVWNLVRNAWQHCKKQPASIFITARPGYMGDAVICELNDDGPGIPAEARTSLFEPFFTTRPGGTGLGLYIARELADANGAALELLPKGPGAHFRLTLKRALTQTAKA